MAFMFILMFKYINANNCTYQVETEDGRKYFYHKETRVSRYL